jgi:peptidyl-tRNA hydrolase, PTH1 family
MKMIVGLGNVGGEYEKTRHNVGFMFLDYIKTRKEWWEFGLKPTMKAMVLKERNIILAKPTTMMNLSGETVVALMNFYKIKEEDLMVVHDDLDISVGEWKCQNGKGPKVHNGVNNIEELIGKKNFWRIRVGIDGRTPEMRKKIQAQDYVLSNFTIEQQKVLDNVFEQVFDYLEDSWI